MLPPLWLCSNARGDLIFVWHIEWFGRSDSHVLTCALEHPPDDSHIARDDSTHTNRLGLTPRRHALVARAAVKFFTATFSVKLNNVNVVNHYINVVKFYS